MAENTGFDWQRWFMGAPPSTDIKKQTLQTPEQQELMKQLMKFLGQYSQNGALGQLESTSLAGLERFAEESAAGGSELFQTGSASLQRLLGEGEDDFSQYFETNIKEPLLKGFEEDVMPRIGRRFGSSGFFGSERQQADESARADLLESLVRGKSQTALGARQQNVQVAGLIPGFESARYGAGLSTAMAGLDERRKRLAQVLAALGIRGFENIATVDPGSMGAVNIGGQAFMEGWGSSMGGGM